MSDTAAANPVAGAPEPASETGAAPEPAAADSTVGQVAVEGKVEPTSEPEAPGIDGTEGRLAGQPELPEPSEPETVEVEISGLKYRVPAALKDGYLQHADYTSKTMDLADKGRALEGDRDALKSERDNFTQQAQTHRENIQDFGELAHTDKLLESFRKVDFQQLQQEDPDQATQLGFQFQMLRDQRQQIVERIQKGEYDTRVTAEREQANAAREHANRKDQLTATLARDIPNYSPELQGKMDETAFRGGYTQTELDSVTDPRMMRMLHLAHLGEQVLQRKRAATTQPAPAPVKPVPKVGGGTTPMTGPQDKQGIDAWMRSRDQQLKRETG